MSFRIAHVAGTHSSSFCGLDCLDLSYPNLHFLSLLVARDMEIWHKAGMHREFKDTYAIAHRSGTRSTPLIHRNFIHLTDQASGIEYLDAQYLMDACPFSDSPALHEVWRRSLHALEAGALPLLVTIPRGAKDTAQIMTASAHVLKGGGVGLRWLHCQ